MSHRKVSRDITAARNASPELFDRYPYTHHGPAMHGSKLVDYLISETNLREDRPDLFEDAKEGRNNE